MARQRTKTYDEIDSKFGEPLSEVTMDGFLSSSYPGAAPPPRNRPEPPRAPLRKPSDVSWEVPPLELPMAPKKRSLSDSHTTTEECPPLDEAEEEEEEETAIFALDGGAEDDDDQFDSAFQLAGFDDDEDVGGFVTSEVIPKGKGLSFGYSGSEDHVKVASSLPAPRMTAMVSEHMSRARTESMNNTPLGASPILLSVLEQVAAAQASSGGGPIGRLRADSC